MNSTSGDFAIAFSTNRTGLEGSGEIGDCLSDTDLTLFFLAAVDAVEESVYDALFSAETMTGRAGTTLEALPKNQVLPLLDIHSALTYAPKYHQEVFHSQQGWGVKINKTFRNHERR